MNGDSGFGYGLGLCSVNLSECSFPPVAQFSLGSSQMTTVTASFGMPISSRTFVIPSTIRFLFSKLNPDQTLTCTIGNSINLKVKSEAKQ
jgi:hypothetical protein